MPVQEDKANSGCFVSLVPFAVIPSGQNGNHKVHEAHKEYLRLAEIRVNSSTAALSSVS